MRENLRCEFYEFPQGFPLKTVHFFLLDLDFRQIMKAIGGLRGQVSALATAVNEFSENQGAVKELAVVSSFLAASVLKSCKAMRSAFASNCLPNGKS